MPPSDEQNRRSNLKMARRLLMQRLAVLGQSRPSRSCFGADAQLARAPTIFNVIQVPTAHHTTVTTTPIAWMTSWRGFPSRSPDTPGSLRRRAQRGRGEYAGEQSAENAADAVDAEHVERIVVFELLLQRGAGPVADAAGDARR